MTQDSLLAINFMKPPVKPSNINGGSTSINGKPTKTFPSLKPDVKPTTKIDLSSGGSSVWNQNGPLIQTPVDDYNMDF